MAGVVTTQRNDYLTKGYDSYQGTGARRGDAETAFKNSVETLFGGNAKVHQTAVINDLDLRQTPAHGTTGIPYAISGTATVIQMDVAQRLADYVDPIKAILGVGMHSEQRVIIKRQYVAGGSAGIVPERAPARTVAIQEDVREVMLTRYGGDIEFNLNLLLRPGDAAKEMNLKVAAQERALENALTSIGYEMLLSEGTSLVNALIRSNSTFGNAGTDSGRQMIKSAEMIYAKTVFGAFQKFSYPVHNLIAAAKRASAYDISRATKSVLIVPHGIPEILKYTKPENMVYSVNGTGPEKIDMELTGGYTDPATNCTIFTHIPPSNNMYGAANPTAEASLLSGEVTIATYYTAADGAANRQYFDWDTKRLEDCSSANAVTVQYITLRMSSAIMSVPNAGVGELLVGYPSTAIATNAATESGRMQLRCYLGSVLYRPEDVLILPDVAFDGFVEATTKNYTQVAFDAIIGSTGGVPDEDKQFIDDRIMPYECSLWSPSGSLYKTNAGHLGEIDSPEQYHKVYGCNVYSNEPNPASTTRPIVVEHSAGTAPKPPAAKTRVDAKAEMVALLVPQFQILNLANRDVNGDVTVTIDQAIANAAITVPYAAFTDFANYFDPAVSPEGEVYLRGLAALAATAPGKPWA